eukprot:TRINITY_DN1921_c0_g1_i1.p1 TRINITY_DN1921_c0_g1~~TRINITY_DN1921_c0_g1_i1.p1  ORF type:complete len:287 (+),score=69.48 TRINITY_DN1921_c0_g1_i1:161-1021(+)
MVNGTITISSFLIVAIILHVLNPDKDKLEYVFSLWVIVVSALYITGYYYWAIRLSNIPRVHDSTFAAIHDANILRNRLYTISICCYTVGEVMLHISEYNVRRWMPDWDAWHFWVYLFQTFGFIMLPPLLLFPGARPGPSDANASKVELAPVGGEAAAPAPASEVPTRSPGMRVFITAAPVVLCHVLLYVASAIFVLKADEVGATVVVFILIALGVLGLCGWIAWQLKIEQFSDSVDGPGFSVERPGPLRQQLNRVSYCCDALFISATLVVVTISSCVNNPILMDKI